MFRLRVFGGAALDGASGPITGRVAQRRRLALLAYLALARGRPVSRDRLMALFWPESDTEQARHLLSDSVYLIRKELGESSLISVGEDLRINDALLTSDVTAFEQAISAGQAEEAVALYAGPLLDGVHVQAAPEFEHWLDVERQQLAAMYSRALEEIAVGLEARGELAAAVRWWRRLASQDPASGRIAVRLMAALAASGDRVGALQHARIHEAVLREEFGLEPSRDIRNLMEELRNPADDSSSSALLTEVPIQVSTEPLRPRGAVAPQRKKRAALRAAFGGAVVLSAVIGVVALARDRTEPAPPPVATILADVEGSAAPDIRRTVKRLLRAGLEQGNILLPASEEEVRNVLARMIRPDSLPLDAVAARQMAFHGAVRTVVAAELDQIGQTYALTIRVLEADTGAVLATERRTSPDLDGILTAADGALRGVHQRLGGRPETVRPSRSRSIATTHSFEAYRKYIRSEEFNSAVQFPQAIDLLREALTIDSTFASAWARLATVWFNLDEQDSARAAVRHLELHWNRSSERERQRNRVEVALAQRDYPEALAAVEKLIRDYGPTPAPLSMQGALLVLVGRPEQAVPANREAIERSRFGPSAIHVANLADYLAIVGRAAEAREVVDSLNGICGPRCVGGRGSPSPWQARIAVLLDEWERAESLATQSNELSTIAAVRARRGELVGAWTALQQIARDRAGAPRVAAIGELLMVLVTGRSWTRPPPFSQPRGMDTVTWNGIWHAVAGDTARARSAAAHIRGRSRPERGAAPEIIDAAVAARGERWREVLDALGPSAARYESGPYNRGETLVSAMPIRWLVATAYDRLGNSDSASTMYEKVLWAGGSYADYLVLRGIPWSFAHQRLVVLYSRMGRLSDARGHWQKFSEAFTNPDPEFRYLREEARSALRQAEAQAR
jgi:DNA-binding SARP family transcriptional activator